MTCRTAIVVLGMQRSGTSALTRVLSLLGASLPRNLVAPGLGNEKGHWEPVAAIRLNDEMLEHAGSSVNDLDLPSAARLHMLASAGYVDQLKDLIADEYGDAPTFVVKDSRIALLFPLWEAALAELNIRCVVAIISRNPVEVARSMLKRQSLAGDAQPWPLERGGLTWLRYNLAAEKHTRRTRRIFCEFSLLLDDWRSVARDLGNRLDVAWPISIANAAPEIDSFLSRDLRHHREPDDVRSEPGIWSEWIAPVFSQLRAAGEGRVPDQAILDGIRQSFEELSDSLRHPASSPSGIPRSRRRIKIMRRGAGRRRICLVGDLFLKSGVGAAAARTAIDAAIAADIDISIVEIGTFAQADEDAFLALAKRYGFDVEHLGVGDAEIQPSFLAPSIQLLRYAESQQFDAIVFQDRNGLGYASAIAKQTGTALADVTLAVVAFGSAGWIRQKNGEFPSNPDTIGTEYIERKTIELADCVVISRPEIGEWMTTQGWRTTAPVSIGERDADSDFDWPRIFQPILHGRAAGLVTPVPSDDASDTTVVIRSHEQSDLLEQNLQGLMQQTQKGFSVIVVDDGSASEKATQYLDAVEERFASLNLKLIRQKNSHPGAVRNAGIKATTSPFVILLDDDDVAFPDMVRTFRKAAQTSNADVVTCGIKYFHDETPPNADGNGTETFFSAGPILLGAIHNCFGDCSGIYRTRIFGKVGDFRTSPGLSCEAWEMHLRIATAGFRILSLPQPLVWYRSRKADTLCRTRTYSNARVIASVIDALPSSALAPLSDYLVGMELEQNRLNARAALERQTAQAIIAAGSDALTGEVGRYVRSLQTALEERSKTTSEAERYAKSLEEALARTREANQTATEHARSLERSQAEMEAYVRTIEAELRNIRTAGNR